MTQCGILITDIVLVTTNIVIIVIWFLYLFITQIDFELAVQEQKRNQAESDVTQLRIKKAEFKANGKFEGAVEDIICKRLKQYEECRIPEIVNRIKQLKKKRGRVVNWTKIVK